MKRVLLLLSAISYWLFAGAAAYAAVAPIFQPGGQACSRTADYQDRSSPGCYVSQGSTSTYNLYFPQVSYDQPDPNLSKTCFVVSRAKTETEWPGYTPGYKVVKEIGPPTFISTLETQWPWDIPEETDYKKFPLDQPLAQFFADTFALQGTSRVPPKVNLKTIVDQYGPLEKLQPLLFQVKDRVDYCKLFESKKIFDETVHYGDNQSTSLSQVCAAIPHALRELTHIPETLSQWYHDAPDMAQAFRRLTPYVQQDQVAWMIIYMYQYDYQPIDGDRQIVPQPTGTALIKLNLSGLSRYTQAEQRLNDSLIPADLQSDTALPQGFSISNDLQLAQVQAQVLKAMKDLGYETHPFDCNLPAPDGEFEPGPPVTEAQKPFFTSIKDFFVKQFNCFLQGGCPKPGFDAELGSVFVGRCTPKSWTKTFDDQGNHTGWTCTAQTQALANVYLLNPTYLRDTCKDFYLDDTGYLRAHFPQTLLESQDDDTPDDVPPTQEKPLLPYFHILEANFDPSPVSSPGRPSDPEGKVDLPTVCQGELAQAKSRALLRTALRPQDFVDRSNTAQEYRFKVSPSSTFLSRVTDFLRSLFTPGH